MFSIMEAIQSTALSHPEACDCTTCRAAAGDREAFDVIACAVFARTGNPLPTDRSDDA